MFYSFPVVKRFCRKLVVAMGNVENRTGAPVRGGNFFDRERETEQVFESLGADSLLLLAPRRVGKTSLMMHLQQMVSRDILQCPGSAVRDGIC